MVSSEGWPIRTTVPCHWRLASGQFFGGAEQDCHVDVVAAGMHHWRCLAVAIGRMDMRGIVDAGLLFDRQRVHIGADQQTWPGPIFHHRHNAPGLRTILISAHMLGHLVAKLAKIRRQLRRSMLLVVRKLRISMEVFVGFFETG